MTRVLNFIHMGDMERTPPNVLAELITQLEALQAGQQEEVARLRRRMEPLLARRREYFDQITIDASNPEARRKLQEIEDQIDEIQSSLAQAETDLKNFVQETRQRVIALRNEELQRLEDEARSLRERKETVRSRLLPAALARVEALQEEEARLAQRVEELSRRVRDLGQLDPPNPGQSQVA